MTSSPRKTVQVTASSELAEQNALRLLGRLRMLSASASVVSSPSLTSMGIA
jgi:hypothetical protein